MRSILDEQLSLVTLPIDHEHARELEIISELIDESEIAAMVHADLVRGLKDPEKGRKGMSADFVTRCLFLKFLTGWSYAVLAFHLMDSMSYRRFCRVGVADEVPSAETLQRNIKRIRPETLDQAHKSLMAVAQSRGIEKGDVIRGDCTVSESNIHEPTDSSLLDDCVRVLTRLLIRAQNYTSVIFTNHTRRAHRRAIGIQNAGRKAKRVPLYRDLLKVTENTTTAARKAVEALRIGYGLDALESAQALHLANELTMYLVLVDQVVNQTRRRILEGESVPSSEKLVSIFEPHTDIIRKDRRETHYGHKIYLSSGKSGLITDCVILDGNPNDATLTVDMIKRHVEIFGKVPRQVAFDGGFSSKANLGDLKALGVKDVAFSKGRGLAVLDMVRSSWVYKKLRNFRAGIEGSISFLKRVFGLDRCNWRSLDSFKTYVKAGVLACNLLVMARHLLPE